MRPWHVGAIFVFCLTVALAAMGWLSHTVLRLDRAEEQSRRQAEIEENVRLALWRMDSALAPIIAQESARPYFAYSPFYPAERAYNKMFEALTKGDVLIPSPLLKDNSPYVLLHFQIEPDGSVTSPQAPVGEKRQMAATRCLPFEVADARQSRVSDIQQMINSGALADAIRIDDEQQQMAQVAEQTTLSPQQITQPGQMTAQAEELQAVVQTDQQQARQTQQQQYDQTEVAQGQQIVNPQLEQMKSQKESFTARGKQRYQAANQSAMNYNDWTARNSINKEVQEMYIGNSGNPRQQQMAIVKGEPEGIPPPANVNEGVFNPVWAGEALLLIRKITVDQKTYFQGVWFDWPAMKTWLITQAQDLLPEAQLVPVKANEIRDGRMLAALPIRLIAGTLPPDSAEGLSPLQLSLLIAWSCALFAAIAVAVLLKGAVTLSERRGAFVSAVTHELRTPLTTFRMYTQMLQENMVPTEAQRSKYLNTLRVEADRLSHLVENVLAYARLERGRAAGRIEELQCSELVKRVSQRLGERAEQAGKKIELAASDERPVAGNVRTDISAVEQILFNLVDNACKYAAQAADERIIITWSGGADPRFAEIRVRDFGAGITSAEARRLFRPFSKSAKDAANSAPGVGLGLALSRRLARETGGDLRIDESVKDGACFVLTLPLSS